MSGEVDLEAAEKLADQFVLDDAHDIVSNVPEIAQTIRDLVIEVRRLRGPPDSEWKRMYLARGEVVAALITERDELRAKLTEAYDALKKGN